MITDATLNIASYKKSFYASTTPDLEIDALMVTGTWAYDSVTWKTQPSFNSTVLDYDHIKRADVTNAANWKLFDITGAVKKWYDGSAANRGIVIKAHKESGSNADIAVKGYLWPERNNDTNARYPYISLTYRNARGLEDYFNYTTVGEASINDYNGNLVMTHADASTNGSRMPASIAHVFNNYMAAADGPYGKGWKLDIGRTIESSSVYGLSGTSQAQYPYVYTDGDGTRHYFQSAGGELWDEDGLGLKLETVSNGYTITDDSDEVMRFDSDGHIISEEDASGNIITYDYTGDVITKVTDGSGVEMTLSYDDGRLASITDGAGDTTTYTYTDGHLTSISSAVSGTYTYTYDSDGSITSAADHDGSSLAFTYTSLASGRQVASVQEKGTDGTDGQKLLFDRSGYNTTIITSSGTDGVISTDDDVDTTLQFDDAGRLTGVMAATDEKELGASSAAMTPSSSSDGSDIRKLNRVVRTGETSGTAVNLLTNHSGGSTDGWSHSQSEGTATFTFASVSDESLFGKKSFRIAATACSSTGRARFYQDVTDVEGNTTYTLSAYVKTDNVTVGDTTTGGGAMLLAWMSAPSIGGNNRGDNISEYITGTTDEDIFDGWRRISVTFTTPSDISKVRINAGLRNATGTAWFDGIQLEEGDSPDPYNMIENGSFENGTTSWTKSATTSSDKVTTTSRYGGHGFTFSGSSLAKKQLYQTFSVNGYETDTYAVSGWAKGKGVTQERDDSRKFKISIKVSYTDGTSVWKTAMEFNKTIDGWQYGSIGFNLSDNTDAQKTPSAIAIYLRGNYQPNDITYDGIQLIRTSVSYASYDDDGHITADDDTVYTYNDDGDLISESGQDGTLTYSYDASGNLTSVTDDDDIEDSCTYDAYGNIIETEETGDNGLKIKMYLVL